MDGETIRKLRLAHPFQPFSLVMEGGRRLFVEKPYDLAISQDGLFMIFSNARGDFERFGSRWVQNVEVGPVGQTHAALSTAPQRETA